MKLCNNCNSYSYGNELCYKCYHKKLSEMIIQDKSKNKCVKCQSFIYQNGYCERCYNNNVPLNHNELIAKYQLKKKCILCDNEVWNIHSDYCEYHSIELIIQSNKIIEEKQSNLAIKKYSNSNTTKEDKTYKELPHFLSDDIQKSFGINQINISNCIICGDEAYGYKYCKNCYYKYENTKQKYKNENPIYFTNKGTKVKSKSEMMIGNFLEECGIKYEYEKPFLCSNGIRTKPDFYIKGPCLLRIKNGFKIINNVYIEHFGLIDSDDPIKRAKYRDDTQKKIEQYKIAGITMICTYEDDMIGNYKIKLKNKLKTCKKSEINYPRKL